MIELRLAPAEISLLLTPSSRSPDICPAVLKPGPPMFCSTTRLKCRAVVVPKHKVVQKKSASMISNCFGGEILYCSKAVLLLIVCLDTRSVGEKTLQMKKHSSAATAIVCFTTGGGVPQLDYRSRLKWLIESCQPASMRQQRC